MCVCVCPTTTRTMDFNDYNNLTVRVEGVTCHLQVLTSLSHQLIFSPSMKVDNRAWEKKGSAFAWLRCISPPAWKSSWGHFHAKSGAKKSNRELGGRQLLHEVFWCWKGFLHGKRFSWWRKCLHAWAYSNICSHSLAQPQCMWFTQES